MTTTLQRDVRCGEHDGNLRLTNGAYELVAATRFGPRILRFGRVGGPNLLGEVSPRTQGVPAPSGDAWHAYGGHRLWHAPEDPVRTYVPDNGPVAVAVAEGGAGPVVTLTQPLEEGTGVEKAVEVSLAATGSRVSLRHRLTNRGAAPVELAPWAITIMAPGGTAIFPQPPFVPHPEALAPARPLVLWPYTRMTDPRWTWGDGFVRLRQDAGRPAPQKLGLYDREGWMAYAVDGALFVKRHAPRPGVHADLGCNVETFTDDGILELETLGPLATLAPGESVVHDETWEVLEGFVLEEGDDALAAALEARIGRDGRRGIGGRAPVTPRPFHKRALTKPDGRGLWLYGRAPVDPSIVAPPAPDAPAADPSSPAPAAPNPHLRWHPLRGEWIAYAGHRQHRTFLPPPEYNPLRPARDGAAPTEVPAGDYDVAVFENRFPTLVGTAHDPPAAIVETRPGRGACEVVVFTQDEGASLGALPLDRVELILEVWADRTRELGARDDVAYVFPFENRGVEVGVTLHHPHGQIYAYPFVPVAARQLERQRAYFEENGRGLLADLLARELEEGTRVLDASGGAVALVPVCARYPYEIWVAPLAPRPGLVDLDARERAALARALEIALLKLDGLWGAPMPYVLAVHQAPTDGAAHPEAHVHVRIYPAYRMPGRLKYLAGSEAGAGAFTADTLPEEKARELRAVEGSLA